MTHSYNTLNHQVGCLQLVGDITMDNALPLRAQKDAPWFAAHRHILVDLSQVNFLDSCAVGLLVDIFHAQRHTGKLFGLCGLQPQAEAVLEMVGLLPHVAVFSSPAQALDSWG